MIVRITGHTKGIGKCLYDDLVAEGHDVVGYSRSNGFDISTKQSREIIIEESKQADVFINCAWPDGDLPMTEPQQFDTIINERLEACIFFSLLQSDSDPN